jgi:uncharacterized membrane protein YfcA
LDAPHNPPVDPVPFGHWTLRDEAAQRRRLMAVFFSIAAVSFIAGYYAQESLNDRFLVNVFVLLFMASGASLMFSMVARDKLSRCPECKRWLRSSGQASKGGTRIFTCVKCGINWDTKVQASGAGEG